MSERPNFGPENWQMVHQKPVAELIPATPVVDLKPGEFHPIVAKQIQLDALRAARGGKAKPRK